jgi:hypothetical protein
VRLEQHLLALPHNLRALLRLTLLLRAVTHGNEAQLQLHLVLALHLQLGLDVHFVRHHVRLGHHAQRARTLRVNRLRQLDGLRVVKVVQRGSTTSTIMLGDAMYLRTSPMVSEWMST